MGGEPHAMTTMVLTATEFEVVWAQLALGEPPLALELPSFGATDSERGMLTSLAMDSLRQRGLADRIGPTSGLSDTCLGLTRYDWSLDARLWTGELLRAFGAARGESGTLAVRIGDTVHLTRLPDYLLPTDLATLGGGTPSGPGEALSVRGESLDAAARAAGADPVAFAEVLIQRGETPPVARELARRCAGAGWWGQFGCTVRDRFGSTRRATRVVAFHDVPGRGRYLVLRRVETGGVVWVTVLPGGSRQLVAQLIALRDETTTTHGANGRR
ncbi:MULTISPECIES: ESX secretion-associated protein EspG [unclassified Crossiella]|uniref:ESX secretion-associated protein EspG n=1 Tax=unclassified Crossiella TaxID=2620835 RepID=UPI001FFF52A7|nr:MULTISPECIES: ESX secretion-associated protein EspG [unclassified Crossiella]MCK2243841.1 ESX secretion-associated protein EspG [Crossiella sp. S99.2]MCK2257700.1 ESX secretion-associated protein EspG [Crossiella sp. S99.1]